MIVDETLREIANWPENKEFRTLEPMNRITLNVILRTIFGAEEPEFEELREIVPSFMKLGSVMAFVPRPPFRTGRHSPWGKLDESRTGDRPDHIHADRQGRGRSDVWASGRTSWHCCCAVGATTEPRYRGWTSATNC